MINLFRKIRKQLLSENMVSKYLIYAIGEILLVVVGILIALQVNNWNEFRKDRKTEVKVLKEVAENMETNIGRLKSMIDRCHIDNQSADIIISILDKDVAYSDSLSRYFPLALNRVDEGSFLSYVGYESLKNVGFEIIQNNELKKEIINLFEGSYLDLKAKYGRSGDLNPELIKFRQQNFLVETDPERGRTFIPIDYDNLIKNKHFKSQLIELKGIRGWITLTLDHCLKETQRILQNIDGKLEKSD